MNSPIISGLNPITGSMSTSPDSGPVLKTDESLYIWTVQIRDVIPKVPCISLVGQIFDQLTIKLPAVTVIDIRTRGIHVRSLQTPRDPCETKYFNLIEPFRGSGGKRDEVRAEDREERLKGAVEKRVIQIDREVISLLICDQIHISELMNLIMDIVDVVPTSSVELEELIFPVEKAKLTFKGRGAPQRIPDRLLVTTT